MKPSSSSAALHWVNGTQFLGAFNDNLFKMFSIFFLKDLLGEAMLDSITAIAGLLFALPFLLFAVVSGKLSDRYSKSRVMIWAKIAEAIIMLLGVIGFAASSPSVIALALFLMAAQSAFFSPAKYGILPEMTPKKQLYAANALLSACTYFAIILGTFLAACLTDITKRHFILLGAVCLTVACMGVFTALCIPPTQASSSPSSFFFRSLLSLLRKPIHFPLLMAIWGNIYFLFTASFIQIDLLPFVVKSMHLRDTTGGYLFFILSIGVVAGSLLTKKATVFLPKYRLPLFALTGSIGMLFLLRCFFTSLFLVCFSLFFLGLFGGFCVVSLHTLIQLTSPRRWRGRVIAFANFLEFSGVVFAALCILILNRALHFSPHDRFLALAILMSIAVGLWFLVAKRRGLLDN